MGWKTIWRRPEIECKSPKEIQLLLKSFETRYTNLTLREQPMTMPHRDKLLKLEAKIHILKNILKIK